MPEAMAIKRRVFPKIFFGWWTVLGGGFLSLWLAGNITYGFAALFKPISSELGLSRAVTSVASSISRFEGGLEAGAIGWAADRVGPRLVMSLGILITGLSLTAMYYVNSLWAFYLVWGVVLATGHNMTTMVALDTAISNWFVKKRGLAIGIKWVISGLGGSVILPMVAWIVATQGWRMAPVFGGIVAIVAGVPIALFCFKRYRPEYYGLLPDGAIDEEKTTGVSQTIDRGVKYAETVGEVEFTLRQAMRTPTFWTLIAALASQGMAAPVINIHGVAFLTDIGIDPIRAASMVAMLIFVGLPFRLVGGFLADRVKKNHLRLLFAGAYLVEATGYVIFLLNQTIPMIYVWFIVYGIGNGLAYGLMVPIWPRYFGRKAIGSIRGIGTTLMTPVGIAAPVYAGWVYDTTGSYTTAFIVVAALLAFASVLMALALPPKAPAGVSEITEIV